MERVFLFETILFYNSAPCFYSIFSKDDQLICEPQPHHFYTHIRFPKMLAIPESKGWKIEGTNDKVLIEQLQSDLKTYLQRSSFTALS